jgi:glycosyltransferase involved in cell wall biosynthesis
LNTKILVEAYNLGLQGGTGIATYIVNLVRAAKSIGSSVEGLLHSYNSLPQRNALLDEVSFYDLRNTGPSRFVRSVESNFRRVIGTPFGIPAQLLRSSGKIVSSGAASFLATAMFERTYTARMFMDFSRFHFKRYGTAAPLRLPEKRPDLFHATQMVPLRVAGAANIYTIHDLVPILLPYTTLDDKRFFFSAVKYLCKSADHIVTVSEQSKADIIALTGIEEKRITNTYQAVSIPEHLLTCSENEVGTAVENLFGLKYQQYFLFCGALEPKKNISRLVAGYAASGTKCPLVVAGPLGWEYQQDLNRINEFNDSLGSDRIRTQRRRVRRLDYLPYPHLLMLMRGARAFIFPSLYEGFGLPVLEAMCLGTPVITSNAGSLREIVGEAGLTVNPLDVEAISKAIRTLDIDDTLRSDLSKRGLKQSARFSANAYQDRVRDLYVRVLGSRSN